MNIPAMLAAVLAFAAALVALLVTGHRRRNAKQEWERMERDLRRSKEQYQELVDTLPLVIYEMDLTGRLTFVNRNAFSVFGYSEDEYRQGVYALQMVVPADRERAFANIERRLQGTELEPQEYTAVRQDGSTFPVIIHSGVIFRDGAAAGIRGFIIDITERKKAEAALHASEEEYRRLFEESKDIIFFSAPDGRIIDMNPSGRQLFGFSADELPFLLLGRDIFAEALIWERFRRALAQDGDVREFPAELKRRTGETVSTLITASAVRVADGPHAGIRGIIRDITERKLLEAQLRQAQKMEAVGQLAGGIAHDFNNILTTIIGYSDLLKRRLGGDEQSLRYLHELNSAADRAAGLTQRLLAFSRKQVLSMRPTDLNDVLQKVETLLAHTIGEDIELHILPPEEELAVVADSAQIEQVLVNLATNARDAMPGGGALTISTSVSEVTDPSVFGPEGPKPGTYAVITVRDTGSGMDEKTRLHIFEPFFTTKEVGKGTGLGLAMAYGIIKQHEGHIAVESSENQGSTFMIYLPLLAGAGQPQHSAPHETAPGDHELKGAGTILIAEDSESVRELARIVLERAGYRVIEAADGRQAVARFRQQPEAVDLVILDLVMPKMNGWQAYEEMRSVKPDTKVLFTSGYNEEMVQRKGLIEADIPELLLKPILPYELLRRVHDAIGH